MSQISLRGILILGLIISQPAYSASVVWVASIGNIDQTFEDRIEGELARRDFRVIQDSQNLRFPDRMSVLKRASELSQFFGQHQVLILNPSVYQGVSNVVQIQLSASVHLSSTGELKTAWTSPKQKISLQPQCQGECRDDLTKQALDSLAIGLSSTLATLLSHDPSGTPTPDGERLYSVMVLDLDLQSERQLIDIMINEFPQFRDVGNTQRQGTMTSFKYWTAAREDRLLEWLSIALASLDLTVDKDVELIITEDTIQLKKLFLVDPKPLRTDPLYR